MFSDSNLAKDDGFLWVIKVCSTTSFREEVKPLVPCHKILCHIKDPCGMRYLQEKFTVISRQVFPAFLPGVSACYC
jgi:hypothetical protein